MLGIGEMVQYMIGDTIARADEYSGDMTEADYELGSDFQKELMKQ